jgi:plasmid stabilization system protein ParE
VSTIFDLEARVELIKAIEYYRNRNPEKARVFGRAVQAAIRSILEFPEASFQIHSLGVRRSRIDGFPFHIIYILDPDALFILAIAHENRKPNYWTNRLTGEQ